MMKEASVELSAGDLPRGFRFGSYVIHELIGRGAMARVYRAEHEGLRKPVALKVMERALLERPNGSVRFMREGQAAAAVKHPNVVDITDVGVWEDLPYLVMELLEGQDLDSYLYDRGPLSEAKTAQLILPVIAGLEAAHRSGIVHRDLKPANIFLARGPQGDVLPKILDFGISKLSELSEVDLAATAEGELMGSPLYMSPEAVKGASYLTEKSDQYAVGVILYECLTGRTPFEHEHLLPLLNAVAAGRFPRPSELRPGISPPLEAAIVRAMTLEPSGRFDAVHDLGCHLWEVAEGRTRLLWSPTFSKSASENRHTTPTPSFVPQSTMAVAATLEGDPDPSPQPSKLRRFGPIAAAVFGLAAAALVVASRWYEPPSESGPEQPTTSAAQPLAREAPDPPDEESAEHEESPPASQAEAPSAQSPSTASPNDSDQERTEPSEAALETFEAESPGQPADVRPPARSPHGEATPSPPSTTNRQTSPTAQRSRVLAPERAKRAGKRQRRTQRAIPPPKPSAPQSPDQTTPESTVRTGANDSPILD